MSTMKNKIQVRLSDGLIDHIETRSRDMNYTPSAFVRYLIIKDKESVGDERIFWKEAVDAQISVMNAHIEELRQVKNELEKPD